MGVAAVSELIMVNDYTSNLERDGDWFIGFCPEVPGANGQGTTEEECRRDLFQAIELILADLRDSAKSMRE